jgi:hypothetical protein
VLGFRLILAGMGETGTGPLCPPHAGNNKDAEIAAATHANLPKCNFAMHPLAYRFVWQAAQMGWKTCSVENGDGIGKQGDRLGVGCGMGGVRLAGLCIPPRAEVVAGAQAAAAGEATTQKTLADESYWIRSSV